MSTLLRLHFVPFPLPLLPVVFELILIICGATFFPCIFEVLKINSILSLLVATWTSLAKTGWSPVATSLTHSNPKYIDAKIVWYNKAR